MGKILLIRHGEVEWNRENTYIGRTDLPLNDTGRNQARLLAARLKPYSIKKIYSSDLQRARETAEIIAGEFGLEVQLMPEFQELNYGDWEGLPEVEIPIKYPEIFRQFRKKPAEMSTPNGENFSQLKNRAFPAFMQIAESLKKENIAIVAHKSVNRMLLCCVLGVDINNYRQIGQGNAALNIIEKRDDRRFNIETINDCCHLLNGECP